MNKSGAAEAGDVPESGPPAAGVDVAEHLRKLLRVLPIALVVAVLVGGAVWLIRDRSPRTYEASLTAQISQQSIGAVFNELTQPYIVLVTESPVLADVVKNGLAPSEDDLRPRVSAMTGPAPSLLIIKAQADSPEQAARLALAVQQSLDRVGSQMRTEAIARSAADLEEHRRAVEDTFTTRLADDPLRPELSFDARDVAREIEFRQVLGLARLTVISSPRAELVAPHPVQEGLFAGLATLLVVAEGLVLARGVLDRRSAGRREASVLAGAAGDAAAATAVPADHPAPASPDARPMPGATAVVPPPPGAVDPAGPAEPGRPPTARPEAERRATPVPYDPETTVLPRPQPQRAKPVPRSSGSAPH